MRLKLQMLTIWHGDRNLAGMGRNSNQNGRNVLTVCYDGNLLVELLEFI